MVVKKQIIASIVAFVAILLSGSIFAKHHAVSPKHNDAKYVATNAKPLTADKAFVFSAEIKGKDKVIATWKIAKGYYIYRDHLRMTVVPGTITDMPLPKGEMKHSLERGQYEVYANTLRIPITYDANGQAAELNIDYQGCSSGGFCYPPMHKVITLPATGVVGGNATVSSLLTDQYGVQNFLTSKPLPLILLMFLGIGLLLAFTPCVLPMIPILTSIIVGQEKVTTRRAFFLSLTYVFGMATTYAIAGLLVALMGNSLQVWLQTPAAIIVASLVFLLLAFSLFEFYHLRLPKRWQDRVTHWNNRHQGGSYPGVFFMGVLSTLIVSPCVTAPLVGVLIYIAQTGDRALGAMALFTMGIGMGVPLLLVGVSAEKFLPKRGPWMEVVKNIFGLIMIAMAIMLLARIAPPTIQMLFWGLFLIGVVVFLSFPMPRLVGWHKLHRTVAIIVGIAGVVFMFSAAGTVRLPGQTQMLAATSAPDFHVVKTAAALKEQLAAAKAAHKPVLLDFYADWCDSCVSMDKQVFNRADVQTILKRFVLLRVDLSANDAADEALLKQYDVIAPPTILFFNERGKEVNAKRIVGELEVSEFLSRINIFLANGCDKKTSC